MNESTSNVMGEIKAESRERMRISSNGVKFIKLEEGVSYSAYLCPAGVWTVGYGHTRHAHSGMKITEAEAEGLLYADLVASERAVNELVKVPLDHNQFDALVSLVFNIGISAFSKSTLLTLLNQGDYTGAKAQFLRWNKAGGKAMQGLTDRRRREATMFGLAASMTEPPGRLGMGSKAYRRLKKQEPATEAGEGKQEKEQETQQAQGEQPPEVPLTHHCI